MPLLHFRCESCDTTENKIVRQIDNTIKFDCKRCGSVLKRVMGAPATTKKMTVDNQQSRAVEVHPDIVDIRKEWSKPRND